MKIQKLIFVAWAAFVLLPLPLLAGDFGWMKDFDIRAQADPSGFRASLATRFHAGDAQIGMVLSNVHNPADAYMVFRLGEMSARPVDYVMEEYKSGKGKGWGNLAKSLGIKPGSKEFHALKAGQNLWAENGRGNGKGKDKGDKDKDKGNGNDKDKGQGKGHGKGKGKG